MNNWEPPDPDALPRVISRTDALARGVSRHAIDRRLASGRWQRVLPHTYLTADSLGWIDRCRAALCFAGADALISGTAALRLCEVRAAGGDDAVLVLVPPSNRARSTEWVRVRRTARRPERHADLGPRRAEIARAAADFALDARELDNVRALVSEVVRRELCTLDELSHQLRAGPRRGSGLLRQAIAEVSGGAWSAPEARAARELRRARVPRFVQNARIELPDGRFYLADFLWSELRAILEIDSVEYHINPVHWRATMDRHLELTTLGYSVIHRPPSLVFREPVRFRSEVLTWLTALQRQVAA